MIMLNHIPVLCESDLAFSFANDAFERGKLVDVFDKSVEPNGYEQAITAVEDGWMVGIALFYFPEGNDEVSFVPLLWVEENDRRKGLGSKLLDTVAEVSAKLGRKNMHLGSLIQNKVMHQMVRAAGFEEFAIFYSRPLGQTSAHNAEGRAA